MAKQCEICGKATTAGKRIQHHHSIQWRFKAPRTNRTFKPNLRNINVETDGAVAKISVCMKCYKRLRKEQAEEVVVPAKTAKSKTATK